MANVLINENTMTSIANAIRTKREYSTRLLPADMPQAIMDIQTGGTGETYIYANGTYDVAQYGTAIVAIPEYNGSITTS